MAGLLQTYGSGICQPVAFPSGARILPGRLATAAGLGLARRIFGLNRPLRAY